jgi:hypothetical protein
MEPISLAFRLSLGEKRERDLALARITGQDAASADPGDPLGTLLERLAKPFPTTLDDNGVTVDDWEHSPTFLAWETAALSYETPRLICIVFRATPQPIAVPKRSLNDEQLAIVRALIAANVGAREGVVDTSGWW